MSVLSDPTSISHYTKNIEKELDLKQGIQQKQILLKKLTEIKEEDFLPEKHDDSFLNDLSFCSISYDSENEILSDEETMGTKITTENEFTRKKLKVLDNILLNPRTKVDLDLEKR